jgi:predicted DNA-binding protein (MmcQ/YjbR family)
VKTTAALHRACMAMPGAEETFPFGPRVAVFKVGGKMFALLGVDERPPRISLKCEPELVEQLRQDYEQIRGGFHLDKCHWNTITCDGGVPTKMLRDLIEDSYDLVVAKLPRVKREELGWVGQR